MRTRHLFAGLFALAAVGGWFLLPDRSEWVVIVFAVLAGVFVDLDRTKAAFKAVGDFLTRRGA